MTFLLALILHTILGIVWDPWDPWIIPWDPTRWLIFIRWVVWFLSLLLEILKKFF